MARSSSKRAKSVLEQLRALVAALPTEAEKQEIRNHLNTVIGFFSDIRQLVDAFPTAEAAADVKTATAKLAEILERVESRPQIALMLGLRQQGSRRRPIEPSNAEITAARSQLPRLQSLPIDKIREELLTPRHSSASLRAIAAALGIKTDSRVGRDALAHQIAMSIANYRGYEQLSGQTGSAVDSEIEKAAENTLREDQ
jgi:hypothetical protein